LDHLHSKETVSGFGLDIDGRKAPLSLEFQF